jgi:hypothetical protein
MTPSIYGSPVTPLKFQMIPRLIPFVSSVSKKKKKGSPVKEPSPKVPFMESLAERCPITTALLHSSFKVPGMRAPLPHTRFPSLLARKSFFIFGFCTADEKTKHSNKFSHVRT